MTHYHDMLARETGHCDWCGHPLNVGETITRVTHDASEPDQLPVDPRWFHARCARQFAADAFW
jgi:hypothetical protein